MSNYKALNQINNIVGKILEENEALKKKVDSLTVSVEIETEAGNMPLAAILNLAGSILGKEIGQVYLGYSSRLEYNENGPTLTFDEYYDIKFERWFVDKKIFKSASYDVVLAFAKEHVRPFYDSEVNDLKMEYVRSHKDN